VVFYLRIRRQKCSVCWVAVDFWILKIARNIGSYALNKQCKEAKILRNCSIEKQYFLPFEIQKKVIPGGSIFILDLT
jgi:hypothetical protein